MTLEQRYEASLAKHGYQPDDAQRAALRALQKFRQDLADRERQTRGIVAGIHRALRRTPAPAPRGLYLYGPVGTGKSFLLDLLVAEIGDSAHRLHFHRFMQDIQQRLHALEATGTTDPLRVIGAELAKHFRVLCLDELYVQDIADAMLLGGLFTSLHEHGVALVFTSNCEPSGLYAGGLQRARFLPTIRLLAEITELVRVDAGIDYRLRQLERAPLYILRGPLNDESIITARALELSGATQITPHILEISGRSIRARHASEQTVWFDFDVLCEGSRSTADYIDIANRYAIVILSNVPIMGEYHEDAARRFIALVDELYDRNVKLLLTADAPIADLYQGRKLSFEWQRTASRLVEMQSHRYLSESHPRN